MPFLSLQAGSDGFYHPQQCVYSSAELLSSLGMLTLASKLSDAAGISATTSSLQPPFLDWLHLFKHLPQFLIISTSAGSLLCSEMS